MKFAHMIVSEANVRNRHNPHIRPVVRSAVKYLNGVKREKRRREKMRGAHA